MCYASQIFILERKPSNFVLSCLIRIKNLKLFPVLRHL